MKVLALFHELIFHTLQMIQFLLKYLFLFFYQNIFLDHLRTQKVSYLLFFRLPEISYLKKSNSRNSQKKEVESLNKINSDKLEKVLEEYGVEGKIKYI